MIPFRPDRRKFLKLSANVAGASLVLGINWGCSTESADADDAHPGQFVPNAWLRIDREGVITVIVAESEMGQGPFTALPMMVAEELEAPWHSIRVQRAPLKSIYGYQITGGSNSVRKGWGALREAGAIAREILLQAAADSWQIPKEACRAERGEVIHTESGKRYRHPGVPLRPCMIDPPRCPHPALPLPIVHHRQKALGAKLASSRVGEPGRGGLVAGSATHSARELGIERNGDSRDRHTAILLP